MRQIKAKIPKKPKSSCALESSCVCPESSAKIESVFSPLSAESSSLIEGFSAVLRKAFPLKGQRQGSLHERIRKLSHLLTDTRSERPSAYMNNPLYLSAYSYYFLWWNLIRLSRLFAPLSLARNLPESFAAVDFGSGPLTAVCALWIACPHLRKRKIRWYCIDISREALAAGEKIYLSLAAITGLEPWKIIRVKGGLGIQIKEKAALVVAANVFNEIIGTSESKGRIAAKPFSAKHALKALSSFAAPNCELLVVEPGNPAGGFFISQLRKAALLEGFLPISPCPHSSLCPFPGSKREKWCHFAFSTKEAPKALISLSNAAHLPKERAALSFIYLLRNSSVSAKSIFTQESDCLESAKCCIVRARVLSEKIKLADKKSGRYCCSDLGMLLVVDEQCGNGKTNKSEELNAGDLLELRLKEMPPPSAKKDPVTGAIIINLVQKKKATGWQGQCLQDSAGQDHSALQAENGRHSSHAGRVLRTQPHARFRGGQKKS